MDEKYIIEILTVLKENNRYTMQSRYNFVLDDKIEGQKEYELYTKSLRFLELEEIIIDIDFSKYKLTPFGNNIVKNINNWKTVLKNNKLKLKKLEEKNNLEIKLAESNLEANKLNLKNSKFNNKVNIANIIIGIINILVALGLAWWSQKVGLLK